VRVPDENPLDLEAIRNEILSPYRKFGEMCNRLCDELDRLRAIDADAFALITFLDGDLAYLHEPYVDSPLRNRVSAWLAADAARE